VKLYNLKKKKFFKKLVLTPHEARSLTSPKLLLFFKKRAELTFLFCLLTNFFFNIIYLRIFIVFSCF